MVQEFRGDYSSGGADAKPKMNPSVPHLIHEITEKRLRDLIVGGRLSFLSLVLRTLLISPWSGALNATDSSSG